MRVMIDIETLGTSSNSVILSIGAVSDAGDEFEVIIDPESCQNAGLVIDARTVMWWMEQSDEARKIVTGGGVPLYDALLAFHKAFKWNKVDEVWCNGADFDFPILSNAFKASDLVEPWKYYAKRDYRTMKNLVHKDTFKKLQVVPTVAHSALADAIAQMETLKRIETWLELK